MKTSQVPSSKPVVLISGYRGLAETLIQRFSDENFHLSVLVRNAAVLPALQKKYPQHLFVTGDIASKEVCRAWVSHTDRFFGRIDGLINNAAVTGPGGRFHEHSFEEFEETIVVNFLMPIFLCREIIPHLLKQQCGVVINLSGGGATDPRPAFPSYGTSKTAIVRMTENLALQYPELRFYSMGPGSLMTPMIEKVTKMDPSRIGKEHTEASRRVAEGGDDPNRAADLALWLFREKPSHFSGKLLSAIWDKYKSPPVYLESTGLWTLRRVDEILLKKLRENNVL
jgi:NAD(P)-dependent dehydrogenase (short-subunit alcohol dehydrogenase family)